MAAIKPPDRNPSLDQAVWDNHMRSIEGRIEFRKHTMHQLQQQFTTKFQWENPNRQMITNPGGNVTIGGANTLTNGFMGIDMSAAMADLTLTNANLTLLDYASQVWNVTNSRALTVSPATLTRNAGAALGI